QRQEQGGRVVRGRRHADAGGGEQERSPTRSTIPSHDEGRRAEQGRQRDRIDSNGGAERLQRRQRGQDQPGQRTGARRGQEGAEPDGRRHGQCSTGGRR